MRTFSSTTRGVLVALALVAAPGLVACERIDPLTKPYAWHPTDSVARNVTAMAAHPADLIRGRDNPRRNARMEADAIERIWTGHPVQLLNGTSSGGSGAPAAAGGP